VEGSSTNNDQGEERMMEIISYGVDENEESK
jgi:hypothetical protein